jgi:nitroreductase
MDLSEAIRRRRMVRRFTGDPVEPAALDRIVSAGLSGPTAGFSQGISVVLITEPAEIATAAADCGEAEYVARGFDPWLSTAAALVVLCVEPDTYLRRYSEPDKDPAVMEAIPWWWFDGGAALSLMLLAAVDEGLAAGFHGGHRIGDLAERLGIPGDIDVAGIVAIGHPAPDRRSASLDRGRRPVSEVVHRGAWQE